MPNNTKLKLFTPDTPDLPQFSPFQVLFGTAAPDNANGSNGDYYFQYNNATSAIYKKVAGAWVGLVGTYTDTNFTVTSTPTTTFNVGAFTANNKIDVWLNGQLLQQGASYNQYTRSTPNIILGTAVSESWVRIRVYD